MGAATWSALLAPSGTDPTTVSLLGGRHSTSCHCKNPIPDCPICSAVSVPSPAQVHLYLVSGHTWNCRTWQIMCLLFESPWKAVEARVLGSLGGSVLQWGLCTTVNKGSQANLPCVRAAWGAEMDTALFLSCCRWYACIQAIEHQDLFSCGWKYFNNL